MRTFAGWVTARPYRLILLTIVCAQLLEPVAGALLVLDASRRGPAAALTTALIATVAIAIAGLVLGLGLLAALGLTAPILLGAAASGALLAASRSLSLAFQGTVLGAVLLTLIGFSIVPGAADLGGFLQAAWLSLLESLQLPEAQLTRFAELPPNVLVQLLLASLLLSWLAALMLGRWWYSLITEGTSFGAEFRALQLGRVAGIVLMLVIVLPLLLDAAPLQNAAQLAVIGFLFQGLAVMHARSRSGGWHGIIVVLVYVALFSFSPLTFIAVAALSVVGLLDNFFALRARVGPQD